MRMPEMLYSFSDAISFVKEIIIKWIITFGEISIFSMLWCYGRKQKELCL